MQWGKNIQMNVFEDRILNGNWEFAWTKKYGLFGIGRNSDYKLRK
jgi:hypothetical protein